MVLPKLLGVTVVVGILDLFRRELTPARFASLVTRKMVALGGFGEIIYAEREFCLHFKDRRGQQMTFNLHNAYKDYRKAASDQRDQVLYRYVMAFAAPPDAADRDMALTNLMPVIRDGAALDLVSLQGSLSGAGPSGNFSPSKPFLGRLVITLVLDSEHATTSVSQDKLDQWGLSFEDALKLAIDNLRDRSATPRFTVREEGVLVSGWHDVFDASRLLLTDMLYRLPIQGDPVVAIPSRDHLLVTGSGDARGQAMLAEMAVDILGTDTRPLGYQLFRLANGQWTLLDIDTPAREPLRQAAYRATMAMYDDQKKLLDQLHERDNIDLFVASYRVFDNPTLGGFISSAQWTRDVDALLPQADYIWFYCTRGKEIVSVAWEQAEQVLGYLKAEPSVSLSRYRVNGFPSDEQMTQLKQVATSIWSVPDRSPA